MKNILYVLLPVIGLYADEIRHLKPPRLDDTCWGKKIVCQRPMRKGSLRLEKEEYNGKTIFHDYGHGGSGWTLGPGCAQHMVRKFVEQDYAAKEEAVTVIGGGVIGLFTAYELVQQGYTNVTIVAESFENLVSHNAGGFLAPSTMDIDAEAQKFFDTICSDAYHFYATIAQGENVDFPKNGALIMPIYLKRHDDRLKSYEGTIMQAPHDVIIDFDNGKQYEMKVYDDCIFMDTGILMQALTEFLANKVRWVTQKVSSFDTLESKYIFNCTGIGAQDLAHDTEVVPVQGHLILLDNQNPQDIDYMISFYVDSGKTENNQYAKRSIYMFPKHMPGTSENSVGVMGGTFIENAYFDTPNMSEFDMIIARSREFFGE